MLRCPAFFMGRHQTMAAFLRCRGPDSGYHTAAAECVLQRKIHLSASHEGLEPVFRADVSAPLPAKGHPGMLRGGRWRGAEPVLPDPAEGWGIATPLKRTGSQ